MERIEKSAASVTAKIENAAVAALLLAIPAAGSCGIQELGEIVPQPPVPDYIEDAGNSRTVTVVTGVEYPGGYDWNGWNAGSAAESGSPSLVVFRDGERVLEIPVSAEGMVSEDIDMHRYVEGHLYTDFCTDGETVISRNGVELFRYSGRERIVFLAVSDGHVLTLGESRDGQGFSSRSDGTPLFLGLNGTVFQNAGLSPSGELRFFYRERVNSTAGYQWQYYAVTGAENVRVELPSNVSDVYGLAFPRVRTAPAGKMGARAVKKEGIVALCRWKNEDGLPSTGIVYCVDGSYSALSNQFLFNITGGTVLDNAAPVLAVCFCSNARGTPCRVVCSGKKIRSSWFSNDIPVGFRHVAGSVVGVRKSMRADSRDILCHGSLRDTLPAGYTLMNGDALCTGSEGIMIGMTSRAGGGRAILWENGEIDSLGFRGIVTGVYLEKVCLERDEDDDAEEETVNESGSYAD